MRLGRIGNVVRIEGALVDGIAPLYLLPLARTAVCDPEAVLQVQESR